MLNLSNFARKKLIQLNKIGRTKIETLFLCQDPRAYIWPSSDLFLTNFRNWFTFYWFFSCHFASFTVFLYPCEVEKLVVIQGIVASVKYPRDKALGEKKNPHGQCKALWLWVVAFVAGAQGRPQVYQLWECGRGTVKKLQPSFRVSRLFFFGLPLKTSNLGSVPNGYLQANWFVVVYLLIHSALNHDYGRRVSCVRGFSGDWLYCSAHSFGLQGKCFPRWAGNLRNVAVVHSLPDMFSNTQGENTFFWSVEFLRHFWVWFCWGTLRSALQTHLSLDPVHEKTSRALAFDMTCTYLLCHAFVL